MPDAAPDIQTDKERERKDFLLPTPLCLQIIRSALWLCVWSRCLVLEIICLICFVCLVMLNVPFREFFKKNNKQVRGAVITGSECHKGRRERVTDSAVIKQASTTFKPLNIDLPHSAGYEGLKFCKCIYVCTIKASGCRHVIPHHPTFQAEEWKKAKHKPGSWVQIDRAELSWCKPTDHVAGL